jgi:hypothetical protein
LLCFFATLLRKPKAVKQKHGIASLLAALAKLVRRRLAYLGYA